MEDSVWIWGREAKVTKEIVILLSTVYNGYWRMWVIWSLLDYALWQLKMILLLCKSGPIMKIISFAAFLLHAVVLVISGCMYLMYGMGNLWA